MRVIKSVGACLARLKRFAAGLRPILIAGLAITTLPTAAFSESRLLVSNSAAPTGIARVVDGDTLVVDAVRVRLEGIDAPETGQTCGDKSGAGRWDCGGAATRELTRMIGAHTVSCDTRGIDKYGRILGHCRAGGLDLNAEMVRRGYAWAFIAYSTAYRGVEAEARAKGAGIWQGDAMPAWDYRRGRWQEHAALAPGGCAIKGNVTRAGRIYHMPWSPWYEKVRLDKGRGERWFCSEADAEAAGWRAARVW